MENMKVFLLFLDGAPYDTITKLAKKGVLENFERLFSSGSSGVLESTVPPISPVAIPALMTGRNPGSSGIFGWAKFEEGLLIPHTSASIKGSTIFDMLTNAGKKIVVLNMPFTYPPYEINGVMISGPPVPHNQVYSYPSDFGQVLVENIGDYYPDMRFGKNNYDGLDEGEFIEEIMFLTEKREKAILYLMDNYEWDFFMAGFTSLDRIQHVYYGYLDEESSHYDEVKIEELIKYYKHMDGFLGKIMAKLDDETTLLVVSDHGFEYFDQRIGLYNILEEGGFIGTKKRLLDKDRIVGFFKKFGIDLTKIKDVSKTLYVQSQKVVQGKIDYSSSKVYVPYSNSIKVNRNILSSDESINGLLKQITDYLYLVVDETTQERIVEKVFTRDEIYVGEHLDDAPDLLVVFREGFESGTWSKGIEKIVLNDVGTTKTGTHTGSKARRGMLGISGDGIRKGNVFEAKIYDVAPTILHLMGISVPTNLDGSVLVNTFEAGSSFKRRSVLFDDEAGKVDDKEFELSDEDQKDILDRLKKLGYVE